MNTVVYLIRHSEPFKVHKGIKKTNESLLVENEKSPLSINGEKMSEAWSNKEEFDNLDVVWSSNYVRAISTSKYFAQRNNIKVNIDDRFNERIHGVDIWSDLPSDFELRQFIDENYKVGNGESRKEVTERYYTSLIDILNENKGKRIAIISHATAISFLLKKLCDVLSFDNYSFNGNVFFNGNWNYLETFKLEFDTNNNLLSIINVK